MDLHGHLLGFILRLAPFPRRFIFIFISSFLPLYTPRLAPPPAECLAPVHLPSWSNRLAHRPLLRSPLSLVPSFVYCLPSSHPPRPSLRPLIASHIGLRNTPNDASSSFALTPPALPALCTDTSTPPASPYFLPPAPTRRDARSCFPSPTTSPRFASAPCISPPGSSPSPDPTRRDASLVLSSPRHLHVRLPPFLPSTLPFRFPSALAPHPPFFPVSAALRRPPSNDPPKRRTSAFVYLPPCVLSSVFTLFLPAPTLQRPTPTPTPRGVDAFHLERNRALPPSLSPSTPSHPLPSPAFPLLPRLRGPPTLPATLPSSLPPSPSPFPSPRPLPCLLPFPSPASPPPSLANDLSLQRRPEPEGPTPPKRRTGS
ncbi:hypothetical protein B0H11DRAFT_2237035 [Mycena galericulata]|nr:hypothetical protein B0H11DRAFT_2237035 [Mycena galericulata]